MKKLCSYFCKTGKRIYVSFLFTHYFGTTLILETSFSNDSQIWDWQRSHHLIVFYLNFCENGKAGMFMKVSHWFLIIEIEPIFTICSSINFDEQSLVA